MPHTLLQLPHALFELSVTAQPWKPRRVQHREDQRIKPRKPCNPASSQIYTWSNLSFSWFISLAVLVQNERRSRHSVAFPFTCEAWSRFAASGCDSRAHTPPPPLPNPPCGCLPAHRHWGIEWAIHSHPACHGAEKHCQTDKMVT